jgi:hypothetical protein
VRLSSPARAARRGTPWPHWRAVGCAGAWARTGAAAAGRARFGGGRARPLAAHWTVRDAPAPLPPPAAARWRPPHLSQESSADASVGREEARAGGWREWGGGVRVERRGELSEVWWRLFRRNFSPTVLAACYFRLSSATSNHLTHVAPYSTLLHGATSVHPSPPPHRPHDRSHLPAIHASPHLPHWACNSQLNPLEPPPPPLEPLLPLPPFPPPPLTRASSAWAASYAPRSHQWCRQNSTLPRSWGGVSPPNSSGGREATSARPHTSGPMPSAMFGPGFQPAHGPQSHMPPWPTTPPHAKGKGRHVDRAGSQNMQAPHPAAAGVAPAARRARTPFFERVSVCLGVWCEGGCARVWRAE